MVVLVCFIAWISSIEGKNGNDRDSLVTNC
jgi:hypothetical protein